MERLNQIPVIMITFGLLITLFPIMDMQINDDNIRDEGVEDDRRVKSIEDIVPSGTRGVRLGKVASTRIATEISDEGMATAKAMLERAWTENITEADIVRAIDQRMQELGSSSVIDAFGALVVSGNDTGVAGGHGDLTNDETNQILPGEVVFVDIGARYNGYVSDITRTFFMGEPTAKQRKIYNIVFEAQKAAEAGVKHGVEAVEIDHIARNITDEYGYEEEFSHCVGHGIGLYVHTLPSLCTDGFVLSKAKDHIITIEPGIYFDGDFGIRIEDDYIVEWNGFELLTFYPRDIESMIIHPPEEEPEIKEVKNDTWWDSGGKRTVAVGVSLMVMGVFAGFFVYRNRQKLMRELP